MNEIEHKKKEYQEIRKRYFENENEIERLKKESLDVQNYLKLLKEKPELAQEKEEKENSYRISLMENCRHVLMRCYWDEEIKTIYHCVKCGFNNGSNGWTNEALQKTMLKMWLSNDIAIKEKSLFLDAHTHFDVLMISSYVEEIYQKNPYITDEELKCLLDEIYEKKRKIKNIQEFNEVLDSIYQSRVPLERKKNG